MHEWKRTIRLGHMGEEKQLWREKEDKTGAQGTRVFLY